MNNKTFIEKAYNTINDKGYYNGKHGNLFSENNAIYSYGYHYPLLFKVTRADGKAFWIRNTRGYSNTTAKHINHAYFSGVVDVELQNKMMSYENVLSSLELQKQGLKNTMASKKRKNTKIYASLENELARVLQRIETLKA